MDAAYKGRVEIFSYLLITGADYDIKDEKGMGLDEYINMDYEEVLSNNEKYRKTESIKELLKNKFM